MTSFVKKLRKPNVSVKREERVMDKYEPLKGTILTVGEKAQTMSVRSLFDDNNVSTEEALKIIKVSEKAKELFKNEGLSDSNKLTLLTNLIREQLYYMETGEQELSLLRGVLDSYSRLCDIVLQESGDEDGK
jgi:hypothetical protein